MAEFKHFVVELPFALKSKSNHSFSRSGASAKQGKLLADYETLVGVLIARAVPEDWVLGDQELPLVSRPVVLIGIQAVNSQYDSANFSKSLADAAEGSAYWNDKSALYTITESIYLDESEPNHKMFFVQVAADSTLDTKREAMRFLFDLMASH